MELRVLRYFLEPADTEGFDYIRLENTDYWVVGMRPDGPMAKKAFS